MSHAFLLSVHSLDKKVTLGYTLSMKCTHNRLYSGIPVGIAVRGSIADSRTFRVRPGNGYYNAVLGEVYQDQYTYFIPSSINNPEGQTARDALTNAVLNWQGFSTEVKESYNAKAKATRLFMSGYNLYIRNYIRANA